MEKTPLVQFKDCQKLKSNNPRLDKLCTSNKNLKQLLADNADDSKQEFMGVPQILGISKKPNGEYWASHYIGITWLETNKLCAVIEPRLKKINWEEIYRAALSVNTPFEADYFSKCYGIDFDSPQIEIKSNTVELTPLLILHFLSLLTKLFNSGLKKGYITREENLKSKVKGRILIQQHLQKNILAKHEDRTFCRFTEFTTDIPENRLLKKALLFCQRYAQQHKSLEVKKRAEIGKFLSYFEGVSDNISISQIQRVAKNKIYKHYPEACRVAKMILQRYDYSISNVKEENGKHKVPPYWIDIARLFELYVYSKLDKVYPGEIQFQANGWGLTAVDYIKKGAEPLIIDAKYKPRYDNKTIDLADIREISGYARDEKILEALGSEARKSGFSELKGEFRDLMKVDGFIDFYKIAIALPTT